MKKIISKLSVVFLALVLVFCCSCSKETLVIKETDTYIVITASETLIDQDEELTLIDYMLKLKDKGELEFEVSGGMITSINGIDNPADYSSCWMLYTSDTDNANNAWGTIDYKGNIYGSSMLGAEQLNVKIGCIYIWVYQSF